MKCGCIFGKKFYMKTDMRRKQVGINLVVITVALCAVVYRSDF